MSVESGKRTVGRLLAPRRGPNRQPLLERQFRRGRRGCAAGSRVEEDRRADRHRRRADRQVVAGVVRRLDAAQADQGDRDRRARRRDRGERLRTQGRPRHAARAARRAAARRCSGSAPSRAPCWSSVSASAPPASAARASSATSATLGDSFTSSGSVVRARTCAVDGLRLARVGADRDAAGLDVRAAQVQLQRGDRVDRGRAARPGARSRRARSRRPRR